MGNLLDTAKKRRAAAIETAKAADKAEQEYLAAVEELNKQAEELASTAAAAAVARTKTMEAMLARQKQIAATRMAQLEHSLARLKELRERQKLINVQSAQLLCAIYYNYQFGEIDEDPSGDWMKNVTTVINNCLNIDTFTMLCRIPTLLPLLWPTGKGCDNLQTYTVDDNGVPDQFLYTATLNTHLESYIYSKVGNYIQNVCQSNCKKYNTIDEERMDRDAERCLRFITDVEEYQSNDEWVRRAFELIKDDDKMNWKCFAARSGKGICKSPIKLLPATWPKICPKYELYEALLMITNTIINHYGGIRSDKGLNVNADDTTTKHTNGGECFKLKQSWIDATYSSVSFNAVWDGTSMIQVKDAILPIEKITGSANDEKWMKDTEVETTVGVYGQNPDGTGGYKKYVNPTQKYTQQFINDIDNVKVAFEMPRLSADINQMFRKDFLYNIFKTLTTNKDYQFFNVYGVPNRDVLTSMDYIYIVPEGLEQIDNVSPICRYMFEVLIKYSCKWYITWPIENVMTFSKVNQAIKNTTKDDVLMPQFIWRDMSGLKFPSKDGGGYGDTPKIVMKYKQPGKKTIEVTLADEDEGDE